MSKITTVGGLEMHPLLRDRPLDTDPLTLSPCPFCGHQAAYEDRGLLQLMRRRVVCSNTSCGVATPWHYATRERAAEAWNRRASVRSES